MIRWIISQSDQKSGGKTENPQKFKNVKDDERDAYGKRDSRFKGTFSVD
jgi:hypothetical protein